MHRILIIIEMICDNGDIYTFKRKESLSFIPQIGMKWIEEKKEIKFIVKSVEYMGENLFVIKNIVLGIEYSIKEINLIIDRLKDVGGWELKCTNEKIIL